MHCVIAIALPHAFAKLTQRAGSVVNVRNVDGAAHFSRETKRRSTVASRNTSAGASNGDASTRGSIFSSGSTLGSGAGFGAASTFGGGSTFAAGFGSGAAVQATQDSRAIDLGPVLTRGQTDATANRSPATPGTHEPSGRLRAVAWSRATRVAFFAALLACAKPPAPSVIAEAPRREPAEPETKEPTHSPEPRTSLFGRAPAGVFAIARFEGTSMREALDIADTELRGELPSLTTCNVALGSITRAEAVATNAGSVVVEIQAGFGSASIACVLGMMPTESGRLELGDVAIENIPGGVAVRYRSVDGQTEPIPADLAAKLPANDHAIFVMNVGEDARRMSIEIDLTAAGGTGLLRFADAPRADALVAWLGTRLGRLDPTHRSRLERLQIARNADGIGFVVSADDDLPRAAVVLREVAEPFSIPSTSMLPTLEPRDQMFVDRLVRTDELQRGDVVVFRPPDHPDQKFVKRIVGLPGDRLRFVDGALEIRGKTVKHGPAKESFASLGLRSELPAGLELLAERIGKREYTILRRKDVEKPSEWIVVPKDHFYAVGDNRMQSHDSRVFGPVPLADVHGRATFVWLSLHEGAINPQRSGIAVR